METKHVTGIFMCIKEISHKRNSLDGNTRIFVLEIPSGIFFDGLLENEAVCKLKLRDSISVDIKDLHQTDANKVCKSKGYNIQPEDYFKMPNQI